MKLEIKIHPGAKKEKIEEGSPMEVWVKEKPSKGRANLALIQSLSDHFSVPKSSIRILRGFKSRRKLVEIDI